jgi:hypothetical protein
LQSAPLGEFAARLALLDAFRRQLAAMSAGGGADAQVQRWHQLSAVLYNVVRYYRQFEPAVQRQVAAGMGELEKQLQVRGLLEALSAVCRLLTASCSALPHRLANPRVPLPLCPAGLCDSGQVGGQGILCSQVGGQRGQGKAAAPARCYIS